MIPKIARSCNPRTMHPWGNPLQGKNPRRPERCSVDEATAPFHGLQVSSVPFNPAVFVTWSQPVRQIVEAWRCPGRRPGLQRRRGSLGSTRLQRSVKQLPSCKKGNEPCGVRASRSRAPGGPESRAAGGCLCCSGS
ncbi:uncharacterized protein BKA55DRAFT_587020 [Fusarium redolens]|jgi:hypothetical protein|uniref:Uncharacterized protein n=1 Tax=Fusarium redolens TaxID=48865 RepID=A0A9P9FWE1_FUSRE|nr:uncharacterized protein BKA55DRAFT_587020 [Fusarium redolens]KAH7205364.1 hypothetical protein BKA55DRAFT_587020 [Fusarium redolens]